MGEFANDLHYTTARQLIQVARGSKFSSGPSHLEIVFCLRNLINKFLINF